MSNPEICNGCYRKQACQLWRNAALRQEIETDGCEYYEEHAPTNFDRITESPEKLAERVVYVVTDKYSGGNEWMSAIVNGSWLIRRAAVAATVEYLRQEVNYE